MFRMTQPGEASIMAHEHGHRRIDALAPDVETTEAPLDVVELQLLDPGWARRIYHALIHEATQQSEPTDTDALATLVVDTLLRGIGADGRLRGLGEG